jgi:TatD DNase family protein
MTSPFIFDTHCHYNLEPLYSGKQQYFSASQIAPVLNLAWKDHWRQAQADGVKGSLVAGADLQSSQRAVKIAQQEPNLFASIGLNPADFTNKTTTELESDLEQLLNSTTHEKVVAIGECGLDYFQLDSTNQHQQQKKQQQLFIKQIKLANQLNKTLIIHARDKLNTREAYDQIIQLLRSHFNFKQPFILHCVSGPVDYVQTALELGGYISFAGNVTYPNAGAIAQLVKLVPATRMLIETDAPFLPPQTVRGQLNQPRFILDTARYLEQKFKIDLHQVFANSCQVFNVKIENK